MQVQGWSDLGVSRRAAAQDGLSGTVGLQQGKGMFPYFGISPIVHLCDLTHHVHWFFSSSGVEYRWRARRIQKDGGERDDPVLVPHFIIAASSIEKLSAIHIQSVINLNYNICARIFNHSMERHGLWNWEHSIVELHSRATWIAQFIVLFLVSAIVVLHWKCQILERGISCPKNCLLSKLHMRGFLRWPLHPNHLAI